MADTLYQLLGGTDIKCWGVNRLGQLGDGTPTNRATPVDVAGLTSGVAIVSAASGRAHTGALSSAGGLKCWGLHHVGQLSDGTTTNRAEPVDVIGSIWFASKSSPRSNSSRHTPAPWLPLFISDDLKDIRYPGAG